MAQEEKEAYHKGADKWQVDHDGELVRFSLGLVSALRMLMKLDGLNEGALCFYRGLFLVWGGHPC